MRSPPRRAREIPGLFQPAEALRWWSGTGSAPEVTLLLPEETEDVVKAETATVPEGAKGRGERVLSIERKRRKTSTATERERGRERDPACFLRSSSHYLYLATRKPLCRESGSRGGDIPEIPLMRGTRRLRGTRDTATNRDRTNQNQRRKRCPHLDAVCGHGGCVSEVRDERDLPAGG